MCPRRSGPPRPRSSVSASCCISSPWRSAIWRRRSRGRRTRGAPAGGGRGARAGRGRFLAIEQVRFGDRLQVDIAADEAESCEVPPLVLQPLVENAVTHGVAHLVEGGTIRIRAERRPLSLVVIVDNPCDADRPPGPAPGLGLRNAPHP